MAHELQVWTSSVETSVDLTASQYFAVALNTSGLLVLAGAGEVALGIVQDKSDVGEVCDVMVTGESKAVYGATVTAGDLLTPNASGELVLATTGDITLAIARDSGVVDEIHTVFLTSRGVAV